MFFLHPYLFAPLRRLREKSVRDVAVLLFGIFFAFVIFHVSADPVQAADFTLRVRIQPQAARNAGAQWEVRYVSPSSFPVVRAFQR